ncbi:SagB/ThcOx family dehydrogenase [Streptomyces sp. NRRL F-5053]|uniref:SagB/ThcOx family dehydrogenase n=1 Tax=Streptomyces sp. NRRL F-5053 TaxID=1463854 RepID=UPI00099CCC17|nr:SagB/ThcOx family dehydrogenase [Streptomyces sp. NRRL F-5053]
MDGARVSLGPVGGVGRETGGEGGLFSLLRRRRSTRCFAGRAVDREQVGGLLWAAQGETGEGRRVGPSAHGLYPLGVTLIAGAVEGLDPGAYRYEAGAHELRPVAEGDLRERVAGTTLVDREWLREAPALLLLSGDLAAATRHFADQPPRGLRGQRYVWLEAGHASQNVYLRAAEAGLGAVLVAGFDDELLRGVRPSLLPYGHEPLGLMAVGFPAE